MQRPFFRFSANVLPVITLSLVGLYLIFFHTYSILFVSSPVIIAWLSALVLKMIFRKLRPHNRVVSALFKGEKIFSFPSEHSAIFAALGVAMYSINHILGAVLLMAAFLIGISRAIIGVHFWRDILGGWSLGIILALIFFI